jgi:hypothetical protein
MTEFISSDIISLLIFVSPGFLTIALVGKFYGVAINMEQFERTLWSLIASTPIGILFIYINNIKTLDAFLEYFIANPFKSFVEIGLSSVLLAIAVAYIFKFNLLENFSKKVIHSAGIVHTDRSVWDGFMVKNFSKPVIVKTSDLEYKGWLSMASVRKEDRGIVLDKPAVVYTDETGKSKDFPCGEQIILQGEDIKTITVLEQAHE